MASALLASAAGQGEEPNKHIAAIKGCFGNTSLTFAATLTIPVAKLSRIETDASGLIFASWQVVKCGS